MLKEILYNALLLVLVPAIGSILVTGLKFGIPFIILKLADSKLAFVLKWIDKMVKAAEQKWTESGMGETKKEFVGGIISKILVMLKIDFTEEEVDALIESAVNELNTTVTTIIETVDDNIADDISVVVNTDGNVKVN